MRGSSVARVGAEAREQRQLLGAHQHVDRVDLDQADAVEHPSHVAPVDPSGGAAVAEALGVRARSGGPARR